jgi:hypothetical protein
MLPIVRVVDYPDNFRRATGGIPGEADALPDGAAARKQSARERRIDDRDWRAVPIITPREVPALQARHADRLEKVWRDAFGQPIDTAGSIGRVGVHEKIGRQREIEVRRKFCENARIGEDGRSVAVLTKKSTPLSTCRPRNPGWVLMPAPTNQRGRKKSVAVAAPDLPPKLRPARAHSPSSPKPAARTIIVCISDLLLEPSVRSALDVTPLVRV